MSNIFKFIFQNPLEDPDNDKKFAEALASRPVYAKSGLEYARRRIAELRHQADKELLAARLRGNLDELGALTVARDTLHRVQVELEAAEAWERSG